MEAGEGSRFGWGRVAGWGENADNCNLITVKIFLKEKRNISLKYKLIKVIKD